jgi:hypothetical protein
MAGSVKSETFSQVDVQSVLHGEKIYLVPDHYDALAHSMLSSKAMVSALSSASRNRS